jgi:hypothetical protein
MTKLKCQALKGNPKSQARNPKQYQSTNYKWSKQEIATLPLRCAQGFGSPQ